MFRNMFLLLARMSAIISAVFIPVISKWKICVGVNEGIDAANQLDRMAFEREYSRYFKSSLESVSGDVEWNFLCFFGFILVHMLVVATHGVLYSANFLASIIVEKLLYLVSSFWLPLPLLTIEGVDRDEAKPDLWFLITLHACENLGLILFSRCAYLPGYPFGLLLLFAMDIGIVITNLLGLTLAVFYSKKMALYANLPATISNLASFGPEVSLMTLVMSHI